MSECEPLSPGFGFIVRPQHNSDDLLSLDWPSLLRLFKSPEGGALLFRGFRVDEDRFRAFTEAYGERFVIHNNVDAREYIDGDLSFATVNKGSYAIHFHIEMSAHPLKPDVFWMYCVRPADWRGRTGIVDGIKVLRDLTPEARTFFEQHPHEYALEGLPPEVWKKLIPGVTDREAMAHVLRERGAALGVFSPHIDEHERLSLTYRFPPIHESRFCGKKVFASGLLDSPHLIRTPGGGQVPPWLVVEVSHAVMQNALWLEWQAGDVLLVDNTRVMHAREAFTDPRRRLLARYSALRE